MRTAVRLLISISVCLLLASVAWGADGVVNNIDPSTVAPVYMENMTQIVLRYGLMIIFGILIAWSIWHAKDNNLQPAVITFGGMLVVLIGIMIFFGTDAMGSWSSATSHGFEGYDWHTYGETTGLKSNFPSQAHGYEMQKGWALAGACYWYRLIDIGFSYYIIPLVGLGGCLMAVYQAHRMNSPRPLFVHVAALLVVVPIYIMPTVRFNAAVLDNPMYNLLISASDSSADGGDADAGGRDIVDSPRVSPFMAVSFGVMTDLAERIGNKISIGTRKPNTVILQAALDARLNKGDYEAYMTYASFCFTAVRSVVDQRVSQSTNQEFNDYYTRLMGADTKQKAEGALGNFNNAPIVFRHALSPYADAIFQDLWIHRWVYMDKIDIFSTGDNYDWYEGCYAVNEIPEPYSFHPNPIFGAGKIEKVRKGRKIDKSAINLVGGQYGVCPAIQDPSDVFGGFHMDAFRYVPFCSIRGLKDTGNYDTASSSDLLPPIFRKDFPDDGDISKYRPNGYDDIIRGFISSRYIGKGSNDFCSGVSPDRQNADLWGCLVAGKYRKEDSEQAKSMKVIQDEFDNSVRPLFENIITQQVATASTNGGIPAERSSGLGYWQSGTYEMTGWNFAVLRNFCDEFFLAPGIHSQIGLFGDMKAVDNVKGNTSNWFVEIIISIGGFLKPGIAGIIAWIATAISKVALMMWPHVVGVMTFILFLKSIPYLVRGIWFGQWLFPIFALLPGIALVCIMPIFIQIGLSFTELGNGMALPALMIRSEAGADFGEAVLQIIGSFFIISAFSLSATFMTLGFGSLAGLLGSVNANAFKLTGAGVAGTMALAGIAASVVTGGKAALLAAAAMGMTKKLTGEANDAGNTKAPVKDANPGGGAKAAVAGAASAAASKLTGASGDVKTVEHKPATELASSQHVEDMRGQLSNAHASKAGGQSGGGQAAFQMASRGMAGVGNFTQRAMTLGSETTGAIVSSLSHGPEGAGIAQGISIGHHLATRAGDLFPRVSADGIMSQGGRSYNDMRDEEGELLPQVPTYDKASSEFARLGQTSDLIAQSAKDNGDQDAFRHSRQQSAEHYRDAARLTTDNRLAGRYQIQAASAYMDAGSFDDAGKQINSASVSLKRASKQATNDYDRGEIATGMAEVRSLEYQREVARNGGTMSEGDHFARQEQVVSEAMRAQEYFATHQAQVLPQATQSDSVEDWNEYGESALARMRAANIAESASGQKYSDELLLSQTQELRTAAESGNKKALSVLGMVYAGAGRTNEAQAIFKQGNISIPEDELNQIKENVRVGRFSSMKEILQRHDRNY